MYFITMLQRFILLLLISFLVACQPLVTKTTTHATYQTLDEAVRQLSQHLMAQLTNQPILFKPKKLVFNPFVDVKTGQVLQASLAIETLFFAEIRKNSANFTITRMTPHTLKTADYLINGLIQHEVNKTEPEQKYYQLTASIIDLSTKTILAREQVWIAGQGFDYQPTPSSEDNPMYVKDELLNSIIASVENPVGSQVDIQQFAFIALKALLIEAQTAYDQKDYRLAQQLFKNILQQPHGQLMEVYGGLYMTAFKLGQIKTAEQYFGRMVAVGIEKSSLPVKFLFQPHRTAFLEVPELQQQYDIWLRQISLYLKKHPNRCLHIIGHTSQYGIYEYNKRLSKRRAEKIQDIMHQTFTGITSRSQTMGKGSDETIVGTIPDNAENAIDRRVEFKVVSC